MDAWAPAGVQIKDGSGSSNPPRLTLSSSPLLATAVRPSCFRAFPGVLDRGKRCRHLQTDLTSSDKLLVTPSYLLHVLQYLPLLTSAVDAQNERDT